MFNVRSTADLTRVIQECLDKIEQNAKDIKELKSEIEYLKNEIEDSQRTE